MNFNLWHSQAGSHDVQQCLHTLKDIAGDDKHWKQHFVSAEHSIQLFLNFFIFHFD